MERPELDHLFEPPPRTRLDQNNAQSSVLFTSKKPNIPTTSEFIALLQVLMSHSNPIGLADQHRAILNNENDAPVAGDAVEDTRRIA